MPKQTGGCDPQVATLLKQCLAVGSFALMATERIAAVWISITHNHLATIANSAQEAQDVRDIMRQADLQRQFALSMAQMAVTHTELLRELADELQQELAVFIAEVSSLSRRV